MAAYCMCVYGTENSAAQQHEQANTSSEQRNESVVPNLQYIDIYSRLICKDLDELEGVLNSILAPVTNRDEEEKISLYFERNVKNIDAFITQMKEDVRFAANVADIQNAYIEMGSAIKSCTNVLEKLREKQFLSNDFIKAVKMKMITLSPYVCDADDKLKPEDIFKQDFVDSFQDKSYPYLLQGFFALHRTRDRKEARELFEKSCKLGNEEARVMAALCDQPKVRDLLDKVQNTLDRINILVPQIIDQQTAIAHEREFVTLFDSLCFTVKQLNRSHLSPEDTVYAQSTWVPAYSKLMAQFFNEWKRIRAAQYFGSDELKSNTTGKAVALDMYFDIGTIIQGIYNQFLNQKK
ncbi:hypothetical protein [Akkermansia sp.]|uniref:hypothetical protein n=1 Tax=Akkermansia sp. TaxID=1872421 RepID=UPI0025C6837C|nr:hypothetical protein [Akkermansia sp.]